MSRERERVIIGDEPVRICHTSIDRTPFITNIGDTPVTLDIAAYPMTHALTLQPGVTVSSLVLCTTEPTLCRYSRWLMARVKLSICFSDELPPFLRLVPAVSDAGRVNRRPAGPRGTRPAFANELPPRLMRRPRWS